jgi:FkbM family methyltransferase
MLRSVENGVHRLLARSHIASALAVKIRNQANCVIAYHLGETANSEHNGEFALVRHLAPYIEVFIDVGANVGSWSNYVLQYSDAKGYLYEPSLQCFAALKDRFTGSNIEIRNVAVSDTPGFAPFAEEENFGETSSLAASRESGDATSTRSVPVVTLDQDFASNPSPIDFLKIDCEGYDLKVLKGATALLSRTRFLQLDRLWPTQDVSCRIWDSIFTLSAAQACIRCVTSFGMTISGIPIISLAGRLTSR